MHKGRRKKSCGPGEETKLRWVTDGSGCSALGGLSGFRLWATFFKPVFSRTCLGSVFAKLSFSQNLVVTHSLHWPYKVWNPTKAFYQLQFLAETCRSLTPRDVASWPTASLAGPGKGATRVNIFFYFHSGRVIARELGKELAVPNELLPSVLNGNAAGNRQQRKPRMWRIDNALPLFLILEDQRLGGCSPRVRSLKALMKPTVELQIQALYGTSQ